MAGQPIASGPALDDALQSRLRGVARRLRGYVLMEGLARFAAFVLLAAFVQFILDYGLRGLQRSMRGALLAMILILAARIVWRRVLSPLRVSVGPAEIARLIERRYPSLRSQLISAVRFATGEIGAAAANSPALAASVVRSATAGAESLAFDSVLEVRRVRRSVGVISLVLLVATVTTLAAPEMTGLWFARNVMLQDIAWPQRTHLIVDLKDGEIIGARGDDLIIEATAQGVQPREVELFFETLSGSRGREAMATVGSAGSYRYRYTFKNAQEDFRFHLVGGDDKTESFSVRLLDRPHVERLTMRVTPPAYTRLEPTTMDDAQRSAQVLPGSTVAITMETNKPVVTARLMAGRETIADAQPATSGRNETSAQGDVRDDAPATHSRFSVTMEPTQNRTLHFALVDAYGLENRQPERLAIRMTRDDPPRVHLRLPGVGEMITSEAILPIQYEFVDTYGLATAGLTFQATREGSVEDPIILPGFEPHMTRFEGEIAWPVITAALVSGERLAIIAEARDFDTVSGPNVALAPEVTLRCVTRDELLAELARREQEFRADFERLVDAQEQLRGRLLTALGRSHNEERSAELVGMLTPLERRQRNIAGSINVVRQQFEQILAEMRVNQLATRTVEERLGEGIIDPLTKLAKRESVIAADTIRRWARDTDPETASQVDPQQAVLLSQMRNVLANMLQWEGYQEVVSMLRDIIRLQNELEEETRQAIEEQAGDIFDD